ncbi:hypothetical protein CVS40_10057 [Lucilia cuprina]|nr:hypothetical protein CVS40_10057 [Lucilia cuprina]
MSKRRGKSKDSEETTSDSQIDYTFDENSENPFIPRPRISESPILTRSKARQLNFFTENSDSPFVSRPKIVKSPIVSQVRDNLPPSLQPAESAVDMGNENEGNSLPSGSQQAPTGGNVNDLSVLTSRLERVLTLNHNAFMGEISNLRQSLVEGFNRQTNTYNPPPVNHNNSGINTNSGNNNNNSFHNQSLTSDSGRSTSSNDYVRLDKWNIMYDGSDDVNDFLFKIDTLKNRFNCSDKYISSNFHTLLRGKADTWFWSFLKQHPNSKYEEIKFALTKQCGKIENDCDKIVRMIERRQMPKESFDDYFSEMVALNNRLSQPMNESKMIDLIKNNLKESLGSLLFTSELFSLDHLRDCARKAEKYVIRQQFIRFQKKHVSELEVRESVDELEEEEEELAAFRYQGNRERKELDTRHYKCWNCDQIGHSFYDCPSEKRTLFCFRCGEKNITTPQCKKHSKNRNLNE